MVRVLSRVLHVKVDAPITYIDPLPTYQRGKPHQNWSRIELEDGLTFLKHVPEPDADFNFVHLWDEFITDRLAAMHAMLHEDGFVATLDMAINQIHWACLMAWRHPDSKARRAERASSLRRSCVPACVPTQLISHDPASPGPHQHRLTTRRTPSPSTSMDRRCAWQHRRIWIGSTAQRTC